VFDPEALLIARDRRKDLCVFDASGLAFDDKRADSDLPPLEFYRVEEAAWPPDLVRIGDRCCFSGLPGELRKQSGHQVASGLLNVMLEQITGTFADYFSCNLKPREWQVLVMTRR
jgi:hypothetical protein